MWIRGALAVAVLAAWALAVRVPTKRQRHLAMGLASLLAVELARMTHPLPAIDHALSVAWYAVTAALVWRSLKDAGPSPFGPSPAAPSVVTTQARCALSGVVGRIRILATIAPWVALAIIPGTIVAAFWLALAVQLLAVGRIVARREIPDQVATAGLILAASSLADVAGPWLLGRHEQEWRIGHVPAIVTWLAIAGWELRCWISARRRRG